jgi:hypothetical protein
VVEIAAGAEDEEGGQEEAIKGDQGSMNGTAVNHAEHDKTHGITTKRKHTHVHYKPAYELEDDAAERLGRDW